MRQPAFQKEFAEVGSLGDRLSPRSFALLYTFFV